MATTLKQQVIETSLRLIGESKDGQASGDDVAHELGVDLQDGSAYSSLYKAFRAASDEGQLGCSFPGGHAAPGDDLVSATRRASKYDARHRGSRGQALERWPGDGGAGDAW